jgi:leucyl-tRNA synthetase
VRLNIVSSGENISDADWRIENLKSYRLRLEFLFDTIKNLKKAKNKKIRNIDFYIQSKLQKNIKIATENFEIMKFRIGLNYALFDATNDLKWYLKRIDGIKNANKKILYDFLSTLIKLLSPFTPYICEEMWCKLGDNKMLVYKKWPYFDEKLINNEVELCEEMIKQTIGDIEEIKKIMNMKPKNISIFVAENWKFRVYSKVLRNKEKGINEITKEIMDTDVKIYGKATVSFIQSLYKKLNELKPVVPRTKQMQILNESKKFLEKELNCKIKIIDAEKTTNPKAKLSTPNKFGIYFE